MEKKLIEALAAIAEKAERRTVLLSEIEEWNDEIQNYAIKTCGHWTGVIEDGELRLGRLLRKLLEYKHYRFQDGEEIPYHCYAITPGDVLFIDQELEWDEDERQYVGVLAETYRNISWQLKQPKEHAKQEEKTEAEQVKQPSSGCAPIILALIIVALIIAII